MLGLYDTRIFVIERDIYARQAIVSYLSWDRRTRVVGQAGSPQEMLAELKENPDLERLDIVVLDTGLAANPEGLAALVKLIQHHTPEVNVVCLCSEADRSMVLAAKKAGAQAFLVREHVGIGLPSAIYFSMWHIFVVTQDVADLLKDTEKSSSYTALPERRNYPRLTQRIEQALWLCVVEGLPAERAAEEMGVSKSTVRSYIKEGYRILEAADDTIYPPSVSPAERAFLRYSALEFDNVIADLRDPWQPAA